MGEVDKELRSSPSTGVEESRTPFDEVDDLVNGLFARICESSGIPVERADEPWVGGRLQNTARRMDHLDGREKYTRPTAET